MKKSIEERSKFLARKKLIMVVINQFQCHTMQEIAMTDEYTRFVKRSLLLAYMVTLQSITLEMIILVHQMEHKKNVTFKSNCAKFDDISCSASCSDEIVSICIAPVKIRYVNKRKEVTKYTLLNNCSQGTFVREDAIHKLVASGTRTKITVKTLNGGQTHISTAVDGLEVASNNKSINEQWIKLPKSYTTSDLPIDTKEVATKEKPRK